MTFECTADRVKTFGRSRWKPWLALPLLVLTGARPLLAQSSLPPALRDVGLDQRLNQQVPLDLVFRDSTGTRVQLGDLMNDRPSILSLVYYECPMLCGEVLNGLLRSLRALRFDIGKEFNVLTVSFSPQEDAGKARLAKEKYTRAYRRPKGAAGWYFLTGDSPSIQRLTKAVGFRYSFDPETGLYAHVGAIILLTPEGRIARYFYGIEFPPRDLRLGLVEASRNQIGSLVDQVLLFCYHYDPTQGKYGLIIMNVTRAVGVLFVMGVGAAIYLMYRKDRTNLNRARREGVAR